MMCTSLYVGSFKGAAQRLFENACQLELSEDVVNTLKTEANQIFQNHKKNCRDNLGEQHLSFIQLCEVGDKYINNADKILAMMKAERKTPPTTTNFDQKV